MTWRQLYRRVMRFSAGQRPPRHDWSLNEEAAFVYRWYRRRGFTKHEATSLMRFEFACRDRDARSAETTALMHEMRRRYEQPGYTGKTVKLWAPAALTHEEGRHGYP